MTSPIIIFNPEGLTKEQVKLVKQALDDAYRAGYETAKEFYQLKFNTTPASSAPNQIGVPTEHYIYESRGVEQDTLQWAEFPS